nr:hypothetical protein [uncultured Undibacterium sp.]
MQHDDLAQAFDEKALLNSLLARAAQILESSPALELAAEKLQLLTHYGHVTWSDSRDTRGQRLASFCGSLFLRGASPALTALLSALQSWNLPGSRDDGGIAWRGVATVAVPTGSTRY